MAMVALVPDMAVDQSQVAVRRRTRLEQHEGIGAAWTTGRVVLEVHTIRLDTRERGDHGTVHGVGVPLVDGAELVAST
ncbi:hypothetical protein D3C76_1621610 [compost metagenome]